MCQSVKEPSDIKYFKILTSYDVWVSAFQYEAYHELRAGASVHKLFVGGV